MRRFEFSDGKSNKFWQVSVDGASMTVTFGKLGTTGQTQTKDFGSPAAAVAESEKLIREKTKKGYVESAVVASSAGAAPSSVSTSSVEAASPAEATPAVPAPPAVVAAPAVSPDLTDLKDAGAAPDEEASSEELPRVLVKPSWLEPPKKLVPPQIEGLEPLAWTERVVFTAEEAEKRRTPSMSRKDLRSYLMRDPPSETAPQSEIDAYVLSKLPLGMRYLSAWLDLMSDAAALKWTLENDVAIGYPDHWDLQYLLARFGIDAVPAVLRFSEKDAMEAAHALAKVESPRIAAFFALLLNRAKKRALPLVTAYFTSFPEASAAGVLPLVLAKKTQKSALPALQLLAGGDREPVLRDVAARYGEEVSAALDPLLAWELTPKKIPVMPAWFDPEKLPSIHLRASGRRLPSSAMLHLGTLLGLGEPGEPDDRLAEVKVACSEASMAKFAWSLFETWLAAGADPKHDWAMTALGALGGDEAARKLAPLLRAWPGESAHARAVKGLDVLADIGSDVALMLLDGIAEKLKFKALQEKARKKIEDVAEERGLTREELADRIAPTLDLGPDGSRLLSFGSRSFRVGFDEHLVPFVSDDTGKRLGDLPKPKASDDAQAAAAAMLAWKTLKKDAKTVATSQILRLERAMCTQRRWTAGDFKTLLVAHPLAIHLVRRLLWATFDGPKVIALFRVAEDRTFADAADGAFDLPEDGKVGLVHRLEIEDEDLRRWGQVFGDYEILQPFAQLEREIFALTEAERGATSLARTNGIEAPTGKVLGLEARGWRRGTPQDAGWIWDIWKPLGGELRAEIALDGGLLASAMAESPPTQKLGALVVRRGGQWNAEAVPLGEMSPLLFSELVRDLEALRP